jgi:hypothetical protein
MERPGNVPLKYYRDPKHGFSMLYPDAWYVFDLTEVEGKLFAPSPTDLATCLSVEVRDIGTPVTARDLPTLREGFLSGLGQVPGSRLTDRKEYDVGFLIGLEARQTFRDGRARRKRWIRLLYRDTLQVRLLAQGASPVEFDFWLPVFNPAMTGFVFDGGVAPAPGPRGDADWLRNVVEPAEGDPHSG